MYVWKTLHIHCSGLPVRWTSLSEYNTYTWKMVLERPLVIDTGEDSALYIQCLAGDRGH